MFIVSRAVSRYELRCPQKRQKNFLNKGSTMSEDPDIYIFEAFVFVFSLREIRVFLRTCLKGELVRTIGMLILLFFGMLENYQWGAIAGFVIFSIGWIILVTFENDKRNKIFRPLNYVDRLIGNVPKILPENENAVSMKYNKI